MISAGNVSLPNATTRQAMRDAEEGRGVTRARDAGELFALLDADDGRVRRPSFTGQFKQDRERDDTGTSPRRHRRGVGGSSLIAMKRG